MAKPKYGYGWALKFLLAAILVAVGIYMVLSEDVVYIITGIAIVLFSLFRVYPLLKTLNKEVLRTINLIEILIGIVLGSIMIYAGITQSDNGQLSTTWSGLYRWFLAFFFYARGLVFFVSTSFFEEKTEVPKFIFHIIALTLGTIFAVWADFEAQTLGWIFMFVSVGGAVYLSFDGYGGYRKYREYSKSINTPKEKAKDSRVEKELPKPIENEVEQEETYIS